MTTHSNSLEGARGRRPLARPEAAERKVMLELARIYVSSSASTAALETLDRLPRNGWDEEARLLRAEALIGLGNFAEAESLLGAPLLPELRTSPSPAQTSPASSRSALQLGGPRRRPLSRVERFGLWRFLLQMRVLHRTGRSEQVLGLGRAFFGRPGAPTCIYVARIGSVMAQAMLSQNRPSEARELYEQVLDVYRKLQSREGIADALFGIANTHLLDCHWDEADALYQECRYRYEELGQSDKALAATINLGVLRVKRGEFTSGRILLEQALDRTAQIGSKARTTTIYLGLAMAESRCGSPGMAVPHLLAGIREARRTGNRRAQALFLEFLGELRLARGDLERARRALLLGLRIARTIAVHGDVVFEIERRLAEVALQQGSLREARKRATDSARDGHRFGDNYEVAVAGRVLAEVEEAEGKLDSALKRVETSASTLDRLGETYERARLEIVRLRILRRLGKITVESLQSRALAVSRPFEATPASPVMLDVRRLGGWIHRRRSVVRTAPEAPADAENKQDHPFAEDDERMFRTLGLVTKDPSLRQSLVLARRVAALPVPVLILGEPGTGREKLARLIHGWSKRPGVYIPFHCTDLPAHYLEAELFGGEGAAQSGILAASHNGTLFLDDVAELPKDLQRRLLLWMRLHEGKGVELPPEAPLDWGADLRVAAGWRGWDVRLLAAGTIGASGRLGLRDDLYRQLGRVVIEIPPLRKRPGDIALLAQAFLDHARERYGEELPDFPSSVLEELQQNPWPGNLPELRRAVELRVAELRNL
jgi:tetratricopeptide (TPR) repeat protein